MILSIQGKSDVFFTTPEAAKYLGFAEGTIRQYVQRGLMKPSKKIGKSLLFSKSECDRYRKEKRPRGRQK